MKIALVVHDYHQQGGHSRYVAELAQRFSRSHQVHVFANTIDPGPADSSIRFHHVPAWRTSALTTVLSFPLPATRLLHGGAFDIVHAQGACLWRCDVLTAHICNPAWHQARKQLGNLTWKDYLFDSAVTPLERFATRPSRASWVIAVSDRVRRDLAHYYHRSSNVSVIPHGVATERFSPADQSARRNALRHQLQIPGTSPAFLFVGDLRKGVASALQCLAPVAESYLISVSRTDPAPYLALAGRLGLTGRVRFCPPTTDIEDFYAAADVFLFPTPYDAFGMVITEAMAAGLPVITTRAAGASEWMASTEDGYLVDDPADIAGLTRYATLLAADPALRRRLGANAQDRVRLLSWDSVADQTLAVYERLLALRVPSSAGRQATMGNV